MTNYKLQITKKLPNSREAGVTLLLSILIISGLTLITLALGTFAIQQLRTSRAVAVTEPTIAAAESGGEQGLWLIKRKEAGDPSQLVNCTSGTTNSALSNNTRINSCRSFDKATFNIRSGSPVTFFLYNPDNINGDADLSDYPYQTLTIDHIAGSFQASVSVTRLDGSTTGINPSSTTVNPGGSQTINISPVVQTTPENEGRMKVVISSLGDITVDVNTDRGMPTFPTIDSLACGGHGTVSDCNSSSQEIFTRRINVTVPQ